MRPQTWIPVTNKRKAPNHEEAIIALAKTFPSTTTVSIQQAAAQITRPSSRREAPAKCRHTTAGRSHKQVTVYTSPPFYWDQAVVYNQINGRLGNAKRSIKVLSVTSERRGLYLVTDAVPDKDDLSVFTTLFETEDRKSVV